MQRLTDGLRVYLSPVFIEHYKSAMQITPVRVYDPSSSIVVTNRMGVQVFLELLHCFRI
jgi:hypothetical protein